MLHYRLHISKTHRRVIILPKDIDGVWDVVRWWGWFLLLLKWAVIQDMIDIFCNRWGKRLFCSISNMSNSTPLLWLNDVLSHTPIIIIHSYQNKRISPTCCDLLRLVIRKECDLHLTTTLQPTSPESPVHYLGEHGQIYSVVCTTINRRSRTRRDCHRNEFRPLT